MLGMFQCLSSGVGWAMGTVYVARDALRNCDVHSGVLGMREAILAPLIISPMVYNCEIGRETKKAT